MWNASGQKKNNKKKCFEPVPYEWYKGDNWKYATVGTPSSTAPVV